ncbi:MAG TPA: glycosyltransferase family 39 protein, partial [Bacteroidales bacterium]|nr:glycosyltransferase family 39 protein [Bacteroidales bacterium]
MSNKVLSGSYLLILAVVTGIAYFINLGYNDIWNPNEGFYADAVRHLLQNNNWLDFFFNNEYRFNKPPVTYWLIALSCRLFGLSEFSIRLPIVLFAIGTCFLTGFISSILFGRKTALWSGLVMAVSFQFLI